jgi:hypothetical protein
MISLHNDTKRCIRPLPISYRGGLTQTSQKPDMRRNRPKCSTRARLSDRASARLTWRPTWLECAVRSSVTDDRSFVRWRPRHDVAGVIPLDLRTAPRRFQGTRPSNRNSTGPAECRRDSGRSGQGEHGSRGLPAPTSPDRASTVFLPRVDRFLGAVAYPGDVPKPTGRAVVRAIPSGGAAPAQGGGGIGRSAEGAGRVVAYPRGTSGGHARYVPYISLHLPTGHRGSVPSDGRPVLCGELSPGWALRRGIP